MKKITELLENVNRAATRSLIGGAASGPQVHREMERK